MKYRLLFLAAIATLATTCTGLFAADTVSPADFEPLWKVAIITDTQTSDIDRTIALISRLREEEPEMLFHLGDTDFEWAGGATLRAVAGLATWKPGGVEFHLAPGNHDMRNGSLKDHLRQAATRGIFRLDTGITFEAKDYLHSRVAEYVPGPVWPIWNPEIVAHPAWQPKSIARFADWADPDATLRYVFKRGGIRFIVCDWSYSTEQRDWLRDIAAQADDSSVTIVLHHSHQKLSRYFEGLEGRHNVKLVLSGHDHRYNHYKRDGVTYITGAGIARGSRRDCDAMMLWVFKEYLRLDRYIIPEGASAEQIVGPDSIWMCEGKFAEYFRPEPAKVGPAYVKESDFTRGIFYEPPK